MLVVVQIAAKKFHPLLYWSVIVASTTAGTTLADFATRSLGIGYMGGSLLLFGCLMAVLALWYWSEGSDFGGDGQRAQGGSLLLGGDHVLADLGNRARRLDRRCRTWIWRSGAGFRRPDWLVLTAAYYWTNVSRVTLFWAAFILTRPLGATVGDFLDKPLDHGGLALSRPLASLVLALCMIACVLLLPQRPHSSSTV